MAWVRWLPCPSTSTATVLPCLTHISHSTTVTTTDTTDTTDTTTTRIGPGARPSWRPTWTRTGRSGRRARPSSRLTSTRSYRTNPRNWRNSPPLAGARASRWKPLCDLTLFFSFLLLMTLIQWWECKFEMKSKLISAFYLPSVCLRGKPARWSCAQHPVAISNTGFQTFDLLRTL